jgi:hypothetical protein
MLNPNKSKKLMELASKAVGINKRLLREEKDFIAAMELNEDQSVLEKMSNEINLLIRKEHLFVGAIRMALQK